MYQVSWVQCWMWQFLNSKSSGPIPGVTPGSSLYLLPSPHTPVPQPHSIHSNCRSQLTFVQFSPFQPPLFQACFSPTYSPCGWSNHVELQIQKFDSISLLSKGLLHLGRSEIKEVPTMVSQVTGPALLPPHFCLSLGIVNWGWVVESLNCPAKKWSNLKGGWSFRNISSSDGHFQQGCIFWGGYCLLQIY